MGFFTMRDQRSACLGFVTAALVVMAGAFAGLYLSLGFLALLALLVLLRMSWLEDNICHDLVDRTELPPSYLATARFRQQVVTAVLGHTPRESVAGLSPALVATQMRLEGHVWRAAYLAALALVLAHQLPLGYWPSVALAFAFFLLALRQADETALCLRHLEAGQPLDRADLVQRVTWFGGPDQKDGGS